MFARMLSTDTIRASAKLLAAFAVSLVFAVAALPALAQQQGQAAERVNDFETSPVWNLSLDV